MFIFTSILSKKDKPKNNLAKNTFMLYILQFSTYFFGFITVPYQTRVIGPSYFGKLGFIAAIMVFFQIFIDFGFTIYATAEISANRDNPEHLSKMLTSVTMVKVMLSFISIFLVIVLCSMVPVMKSDIVLYLIFTLNVIAISFLPDYIYRGIERMSPITGRTILMRILFTALIFILVRVPSDYYWIPVSSLLGNLAALIFAYIHMGRKLNIRMSRIDAKHVVDIFKKSSKFFYSRIATAMCGAGNTVVLGAMNAGASLGYYASADKLLTTTRSLASPIADSIYPYMIKTKDFLLIKKILKIAMPVIVLGCVVAFIFAEQFCVFIFGEEFRGGAPVLRAFIPIFIFVLPNYLLGFPSMSPLGLSKYANMSVIIGSILHIILLALFYLSGGLNIVTAAIIMSFTEFFVLAFRIFIIYNKVKLLGYKD